MDSSDEVLNACFEEILEDTKVLEVGIESSSISKESDEGIGEGLAELQGEFDNPNENEIAPGDEDDAVDEGLLDLEHELDEQEQISGNQVQTPVVDPDQLAHVLRAFVRMQVMSILYSHHLHKLIPSTRCKTTTKIVTKTRLTQIHRLLLDLIKDF